MLALRKVVTSINPIQKLARCQSSAGKFIDLKMDEKTKTAIVTMQKPPVNSMSYGLLDELLEVLDELENHKVNGMVLTSALDSVFSAGLDVKEIYKPQEEKSKKFWTALQETWLKLYGSSYPTVAAINGHSPAGACILTMCCEYRVMVNNFTIGLNESKLGLVVPKWCVASMLNILSKRDTEIALTSGHLFTTEEALKIGLVDEVARDKEDALARAAKFIKRFAEVNPLARQLVKSSLRETELKYLMNNREADLNMFWDSVTQPKVQNSLDKFVEGLKTKDK